VAVRDELAFFLGLLYFQEGRLEEARVALVGYFQDGRYDRVRRFEALMMAGQTHLVAREYVEAGAYFKQVRERLLEVDEVMAMRAGVSELHALVEQGEERLGDALALIRTIHAHADAVESLIGFHNRVLQVGAMWLDLGLGGEGEEAETSFRNAIVAFQILWSRERLLRHQRARAEHLEREIAMARLYPERNNELMSLKSRLDVVKRDLEGLEEREDFDAVVRFRLAMAFMRLERFREAGMLLERMLAELPVGGMVEQAAMPLLQCWFQEQRWEKVVECADLYSRRFGGLADEERPNHSRVLLLKAAALERDGRYRDAAGVCEQVTVEFPDSEDAGRAWFQWGYLLLLLDEPDQARGMFAAMAKRYPESDLLAGAAYWEGEALALMGEYDEARAHLADFLERVEAGELSAEYADAAVFRRAYCTFAAARYAEAIDELGAFIKAYPGSFHVAEALLLRGDAQLGEGMVEEGMLSYNAIGREAGALWEEARFKMGNVLRQSGELEAVRAHFGQFIDEAAESARVAEALHWVMWSLREEGDNAGALEMGMEAFERLAGDPAQMAVEDISGELVRLVLQAGEPVRVDFTSRLERMVAAVADDLTSRTLALRAIWTLAAIERVANEERARITLMRAVDFIEFEDQNPRVLVDIADALRQAGFHQRADEIYAETRRWHPRSLERGRILIGRALIAESAGELESALASYEELEEHTLGLAIKDLGHARIARAKLHAGLGRADKAHTLLTEVQGDRELPARIRAKGFLVAGSLWEESGDGAKAAACYERVYVAYEGFVDLAAEAYSRRADVLEGMGKREQAEEVRAEMRRLAADSGDPEAWAEWLPGMQEGEASDEVIAEEMATREEGGQE